MNTTAPKKTSTRKPSEKEQRLALEVINTLRLLLESGRGAAEVLDKPLFTGIDEQFLKSKIINIVRKKL
jgi:hypothetical protein